MLGLKQLPPLGYQPEPYWEQVVEVDPPGGVHPVTGESVPVHDWTADKDGVLTEVY